MIPLSSSLLRLWPFMFLGKDRTITQSQREMLRLSSMRFWKAQGRRTSPAKSEKEPIANSYRFRYAPSIRPTGSVCIGTLSHNVHTIIQRVVHTYAKLCPVVACFTLRTFKPDMLRSLKKSQTLL